MAIQDLLQHPDLWRAGQLRAVQALATTPSGFAALDAHLPGNGWPEAGLMEFMLATSGIGELKLLAPALVNLSRQARWIAWIKSPEAVSMTMASARTVLPAIRSQRMMILRRE